MESLLISRMTMTLFTLKLDSFFWTKHLNQYKISTEKYGMEDKTEFGPGKDIMKERVSILLPRYHTLGQQE